MTLVDKCGKLYPCISVKEIMKYVDLVLRCFGLISHPSKKPFRRRFLPFCRVFISGLFDTVFLCHIKLKEVLV